MLMTCPAPRSTIPGSTQAETLSRPRTLVSSIRSQSSGSSVWIGPRPAASPALLTSTSIGSHCAGSEVRAADTWARSRTSRVSGRTASPCSARRSASRSVRRAAATTRSPPARKASAQARPMPLEAPVTSTIRPALTGSPLLGDGRASAPGPREAGRGAGPGAGRRPGAAEGDRLGAGVADELGLQVGVAGPLDVHPHRRRRLLGPAGRDQLGDLPVLGPRTRGDAADQRREEPAAALGELLAELQ